MTLVSPRCALKCGNIERPRGAGADDMTSTDVDNMTIKRLQSGYWHARWSTEVWAQWPVWESLNRSHFFHGAWTWTAERQRQAQAAAHEAEVKKRALDLARDVLRVLGEKEGRRNYERHKGFAR
jgi:hypothetical protein